MTLQLNSLSPELDSICRAVEERVRGVPELSQRAWEVVLLQDFSDFPEAEFSLVYDVTPAAYRRSADSIYVNDAAFFKYTRSHQLGILVHEVGHAFRAQLDSGANEGEGGLHECMWADQLACSWGCADEIIDERRQSRGDSYASALSAWADRSAFVTKMAQYRMLLNAGLL